MSKSRWVPSLAVAEQVMGLLGPALEQSSPRTRPGRAGRPDAWYAAWAAAYVVLNHAGCPHPVETLAEMASFLESELKP